MSRAASWESLIDFLLHRMNEIWEYCAIVDEK
jgi:hypothetical protein